MNEVDVGVVLTTVRNGVVRQFELEIMQANPNYSHGQIQVALKALNQQGLIDSAVLRQLIALNAHFTQGQTKKGRVRRAALGVGTLAMGYVANLLLSNAEKLDGILFGMVVLAILVLQFVEVWTE